MALAAYAKPWVLRLAAAVGVVAVCAFGAPTALAASSPHLYWTDFIGGTIGRADLQGTNATAGFLSPPHHPYRGAVDGQYIYWTGANSASAIGRANLDGTAPNPTFITGVSVPQGIAVGAQHIYWSDAGTNTIGRANLDGTQVNKNFIAGAGGDGSALALDGQHVYWSNLTAGTIGRANLDGTGVNSSFIGGAHDPNGVAVDGHYIYWTNQGKGTIGRANLDGSGVNQNFIAGINAPAALAVDSQRIYWTSVVGNVGEADLAGSNVNQTVITGGSNDMLGIAVSVPVARVSPASPAAFASATVGKPSGPQFLTLTNTGQQALSWSDPTLTGADPGDFTASPTTCPPSLAPGASCQLLVSFIPQAAGTRTATLQIITNDVANGPIDVPLSGTGTSAPPTGNGTGNPGTGQPSPSTATGSSNEPPTPARASSPVQLITCRAIVRRQRTRHTCTARTVTAATRLAAHGRATMAVRIARGRAVFATGTAVLPARGTWQLLVRDLRPVGAGAYTLILSRSRHGQRSTTRQAITVH